MHNPARRHRFAMAGASHLVAGAIVALVIGAGGLAGAQFADFDADGLHWMDERAAGTNPQDPDTDGDRVADGDEVAAGTDPLDDDSDDDGLLDGEDARRGGNPLSADTDGDGIGDREEPERDCDGDGVGAIGSSDDDSDGRPDAEEPWGQQCAPDSDGDGVLDGYEGHADCVTRPDCDGDDLLDGDEPGLGTDPLRADTFGIGFPDPVGLALGGTSQGDGDLDGIPDDWERADGPMPWGPFTPRPGSTDLLVEYIRVTGPDSGRYDLDLGPALEAVEAMFAREGIRLDWSLTTVQFPSEHRPDFLTPDDIPHYRAVLENATSSANPYVTSVILNPQQVQFHVGDILGAAFLRSMVATVDLGPHTVVQFETQETQPQTIRIRPIVESHIQSGNADLVTAYGFQDGGVRSDGHIFLVRDVPDGVGYTVSWRPEWFRTAPLFVAETGEELATIRVDYWVEDLGLASTIAHEVGHTLGLCHTHLASCQETLGVSANRASQSTMSYTATQETLHFLPEEWQRLREHLRCPPQTTARLVAEGAGDDAILAAKYDAAFFQETPQRECLEFVSLERQFEPRPATLVAADPLALDRGTPGAPRIQAYVWSIGAAALVSGGLVAWWRRPAQPGTP